MPDLIAAGAFVYRQGAEHSGSHNCSRPGKPIFRTRQGFTAAFRERVAFLCGAGLLPEYPRADCITFHEAGAPWAFGFLSRVYRNCGGNAFRFLVAGTFEDAAHNGLVALLPRALEEERIIGVDAQAVASSKTAIVSDAPPSVTSHHRSPDSSRWNPASRGRSGRQTPFIIPRCRCHQMMQRLMHAANIIRPKPRCHRLNALSVPQAKSNPVQYALKGMTRSECPAACAKLSRYAASRFCCAPGALVDVAAHNKNDISCFMIQ